MAIEWSMFFKRNLVSLMVVFGLGVFYAFMMGQTNNNSWFTAGAVAIALYFSATLMLWTINVISGAIYIWLFFEKDIASSVLNGLRDLKISPPKRHDEKTMAYLLGLANDSTAEIADRLKAASFAAGFEATKSGMSYFRARAYARAANVAVSRFYLEQASAERSNILV